MAEVILENCRLSFLNCFKPKANKAGALKYSASVMIPESEIDTYNTVLEAIEEAITLAVDAGEIREAYRSKVEKPIRSGTEENAVGTKDSSFVGYWFLNAYSDNPPGVISEKGKPILDHSQMYSGVWAHVAVNFYFTKKGGTARVAVGLNHLMKVRDDDHLDGRTSPTEAFAKYLANRGAGKPGDLT